MFQYEDGINNDNIKHTPCKLAWIYNAPLYKRLSAKAIESPKPTALPNNYDTKKHVTQIVFYLLSPKVSAQTGK